MRLSKNLLIDAAMILAVILIGAAGYKLSPLLLPKVDVSSSPEPGCDLHSAPCRAALPQGGRLSFSLMPRPVSIAVPLEMSVDLEGVRARRVTVDFSGVGMNMGLNRYDLALAGNGRFAGQVTLPVCITGRMAWEATVLVETDHERIAVPFRFEAGA